MMTKLIVDPFRIFKNRTFAKLFTSQLASLVGDAFTWLGLALISYELNPRRASAILASALTMRVLAYPFFAVFRCSFRKFCKEKYFVDHTRFQNDYCCIVAFCDRRMAITGAGISTEHGCRILHSHV